ncbi:MAG: dihydroxy-acid dehydratase, partial [Variovorax sp.]
MATNKPRKTPTPKSTPKAPRKGPARLRSQAWYDNPDNADMTALYIERTMNFGLSFDELQSGRPMIGIA